MELVTFSIFMLIGLIAGMAGGLLGIGGSAIFIPAASLAIGVDQQIYQASAMILNVFVAASATLKHYRSRGIDFSVVGLMMPFAVGSVLIGVYASNHIDGSALARGFGVMLITLGCFEFAMLATGFVRRRRVGGDRDTAERSESQDSPRARTPYRMIGTAMGGLGGLLGIGGGIVGVPLLRFVARQPLRRSIAAAAAVTLPLALVGAIYKNISLPYLPGEDASSSVEALLIAAAIVPTAIVGSWFGASLVHRLPIDLIRVAFVALLLFAGYRMTTRPTTTPADIEPSAREGIAQSPDVLVTSPHWPPTSPTIPKIGNSAS